MSLIGQAVALRGKLQAQNAMQRIMRQMQNQIKDITNRLSSLNRMKRANINALNAEAGTFTKSLTQDSIFTNYIQPQFGASASELRGENGKWTPEGLQILAQTRADIQAQMNLELNDRKSYVENVYDQEIAMLEEDKAELEAQLQTEKLKYENLEKGYEGMYETNKKWNESNQKQMFS